MRGRRRRQSGKLLVSPLIVPVGKSRLMQQLRSELQQLATHPLCGVARGRAGLGPRGVRALPARTERPQRAGRSCR